ncbi:MAG TPA: hypothetical protein VKQ32_12640 [Polyangia bacterium]|nr:hypothetical protein [Polyangia bacterium]
MTTTPDTNRELEFVNTFVVSAKRARYSALVASPRLRPQFLEALRDFSHFNPRFKVRLPRSQDSTRGYLIELRRRTGTPNAYLISSHKDLDAVTLPLDDALGEVHGRWDGTVMICTPSLAYYEGQWTYRFILDHQPLRGAR